MAEEEKIVLTLGDEQEEVKEEEKEEVKDLASVPVSDVVGYAKLDDSGLSEEEKKMVEEFSKKIDITDSNLVLNYGAAAQKSVASFSENALASVRNKDLGEVGDTLSKLVVEVKGFGKEEKKGLAGLFQKQRDKLALMKEQ